MQQPDKKKILFVVQLPPPVHGASVSNNLVVNSLLIKHNFNTAVIDLQFTKSLLNIKKFSFVKVYKAVFYAVKIVKKMFSFRPHLVYFTLSSQGFAFYRDVMYIFLFRLFNTKIVYHLHSKGIKENTENSNFKRKICLWVFKNTNVICVGKKLISDIDNVYAGQPFIVPYGIAVRPAINRDIKKEGENIPRLIYLSNYIRTKGILVLIDALEILKNKGYSFTATLAGSPTDLGIEELRSIVTAKGMGKLIDIVGALYGEDKFKAYENADIFVFPTFYKNETFGIVNLEAMQYSLPVVSTFEGGIPDVVIDNETGLLAMPQNVSMLADKIAVLLNNPQLCIDMGKKGYKRFMANYTLDHFEQNIDMAFKNILN
jgi:glycosyltransferase involved in cell wall biosynthesis